MRMGISIGVNRNGNNTNRNDAYFNTWFLISGTWDDDLFWRDAALWDNDWFLATGTWYRGGYWKNAEAW